MGVGKGFGVRGEDWEGGLGKRAGGGGEVDGDDDE